jgi:hypothetical protein
VGLADLQGQEATGNSRASGGASEVCCFGSPVFSVTATSTWMQVHLKQGQGGPRKSAGKRIRGRVVMRSRGLLR